MGAYLGDAVVERLLASPLGGSTPQQRAAWLDQARHLAAPPSRGAPARTPS
ncbi:hypothetical protein H9623_11830 [Oerskovia sp. Sa1BUA8]|uniref:Uncharacterized protein n=1 Tax=Oerskovia douganii TaxID=2762210 RepID=A0A9D5YYS6_9CELL|nr:hypothetical protein [Oerskovia douganii]MBE7700988.1 hypothetical protein [Oerskovia douganii]